MLNSTLSNNATTLPIQFFSVLFAKLQTPKLRSKISLCQDPQHAGYYLMQFSGVTEALNAFHQLKGTKRGVTRPRIALFHCERPWLRTNGSKTSDLEPKLPNELGGTTIQALTPVYISALSPFVEITQLQNELMSIRMNKQALLMIEIHLRSLLNKEKIPSWINDYHFFLLRLRAEDHTLFQHGYLMGQLFNRTIETPLAKRIAKLLMDRLVEKRELVVEHSTTLSLNLSNLKKLDVLDIFFEKLLPYYKKLDHLPNFRISSTDDFAILLKALEITLKENVFSPCYIDLSDLTLPWDSDELLSLSEFAKKQKTVLIRLSLESRPSEKIIAALKLMLAEHEFLETFQLNWETPLERNPLSQMSIVTDILIEKIKANHRLRSYRLEVQPEDKDFLTKLVRNIQSKNHDTPFRDLSLQASPDTIELFIDLLINLVRTPGCLTRLEISIPSADECFSEACQEKINSLRHEKAPNLLLIISKKTMPIPFCSDLESDHAIDFISSSRKRPNRS